jgi:tetratricopeptide (TPR) repeat protein
VVNRIVFAGAVVLLVLLGGCETEIERKARMTEKLKQEKRQDALDALEKVRTFAATVNPKDPAQIIQVIEKLQSEEMQSKMTAVPDVEDERKRVLFEWNDKYLALCGDAWRSARRAANDALKAGEYDRALAALDAYPEALRTYAHEYWDDLQRYKEGITKLKEAPEEALEAIHSAEAAADRGDYEAAVEICFRSIARFQESGDAVALRILINEHISVIDRWVDEIAKKGSTEAAIEKLVELCGVIRGSKEHDFYIQVKERELRSK